LYSTFLGGSNGEVPQGLALDGSGAAFVTGVTSSGDFPVTAGAFDTTSQGSSDAFVTHLDPAGNALLYSTLLGGSSGDVAEDLTVDASGAATVVGVMSSTDFPTTPGAFQTVAQGTSDAFVTRLAGTGSALLYSTLLGGSSGDVGRGVTLDSLGSAAVVGDTSSSDFPATVGAFDTTSQGSADAFLAILNSIGTGLLYSTYLGGGGGDGAYAVGIGGPSSVTVAGVTNSSDFPASQGAFDTSLAGSGDGFVARLSLPPCGASAYGSSTPACSGPIQIGVTRCPHSGDPLFAVTCLYAPPAAAGVLLLGVGQDLAGTPVLGVTLHVSFALPLFLLSAASNGVGVATRPIPIPGGTAGAQVFAQFVWLNTAVCGGLGTFSASNALVLTVD
ncbi:MAG: SBBP repeat-containing protein, partial [Planctomycetota bacterium]